MKSLLKNATAAQQASPSQKPAAAVSSPAGISHNQNAPSRQNTPTPGRGVLLRNSAPGNHVHHLREATALCPEGASVSEPYIPPRGKFMLSSTCIGPKQLSSPRTNIKATAFCPGVVGCNFSPPPVKLYLFHMGHVSYHAP